MPTCKELDGRKTGFSIDEKGVWSFTASSQWQILSASSRLTGYETVPGFPQPGSSWEGVPRLRLYDVQATEGEKHTDGGYKWVVTCKYTSRPFNHSESNSKDELTTDPISWMTRWTGWRAEEMLITPMQDLDKKKWLNPAKDMFDNVPQITVVGASATAIKNFSSFEGSYALGLIGKCNLETFFGREKGQVKITDIVPTEKDNGEYTYYEVAVTFSYNPMGWDIVEVLNEGCHVLVPQGFGSVRSLPTDPDTGAQHTSSVLLNEDGTQAEYSAESFEATYTKFRVCDYFDFNLLQL